MNLHYKTFFHLCRLEGISYDLDKRIGTTFVLLDSLQIGLLGIISIADSQ